MISNDMSHETIFAIPLIKQNHSNLGGGGSRMYGRELYLCPQEVCHCENSILPIFFWQRTNEVKCNHFKVGIRYGKRV
jgi:hypothetical protein